MDNTTELPAIAGSIVELFTSEICSMEPGFIDGIYLTGSLTVNDFYPGKSDIDFLVLCKTLPDKQTAARIKQVHKSIEKRYAQPRLSGSYLAAGSLYADDPESIPTLSYHAGSVHYQHFDMAPVALAELKFNAYTVLGRNAGTLPVEITRQQMDDFLHRNIHSYWRKWMERHAAIFKRKILLFLFPRLTEWAVLGVARQIYTLQTGKITSKRAAGFYCLTFLPDRFHPIIRQAIAIREDDRSYPFVGSYGVVPSFKRMAQTIECVNYLIAVFDEVYSGKGGEVP